MKTIHVNASKSYDILIERGILDRAGEEIKTVWGAGEALIVSDDTVWDLYGETVLASMQKAGFDVTSFTFPHGEQSKNLSVYADILNALAARHLSRKGLVVALGGGVVGDMAGFAAATYLRGVRFVQIPTTLLSQVDSSVGGKTAVDLPAGKNLVGAFCQPSLVLCDPHALSTLPAPVFYDGCAEVIKAAMLKSHAFFEDLQKTPPREQLEHMLEFCISMKRDVVEEDEFDTGARQYLNLGHTFGHAVEAASAFSISHGCAVSIGMVMMTRAAVKKGYCKEDTLEQLIALLKQYHLPTEVPYPALSLLGIVRSDKKTMGGTVTLVVPEKIGRCTLVPVPVCDVPDWLTAGGAQ